MGANTVIKTTAHSYVSIVLKLHVRLWLMPVMLSHGKDRRTATPTSGLLGLLFCTLATLPRAHSRETGQGQPSIGEKLQVRHGLVLAMLLHGINRRTASLTADLVGRTSLHAGNAAPSTLKGNWPEATFYSRKLQVRVGLVPATFLRGIDRRTATLTSALVGRTSLHPGNGPASTLKRNRPGATFHDPSQVRYALRCLQQKDKRICLSRSRPATYFSAVIASGPNRASLETKSKNELRNQC